MTINGTKSIKKQDGRVYETQLKEPEVVIAGEMDERGGSHKRGEQKASVSVYLLKLYTYTTSKN